MSAPVSSEPPSSQGAAKGEMPYAHTEEETLTDGSKVYNVVLGIDPTAVCGGDADAIGDYRIVIDCPDEETAHVLQDALNDASSITLDCPLSRAISRRFEQGR